jgi:hypothetical protein
MREGTCTAIGVFDPDPLEGRFLAVDSHQEPGKKCVVWVRPIRDGRLIRLFRGPASEALAREAMACELNQQILDLGGPLLTAERVADHTGPADPLDEFPADSTEEILRRLWVLHESPFRTGPGSEFYQGALYLGAHVLSVGGYATVTTADEVMKENLEHHVLLWAITNDLTPASRMAAWLKKNYHTESAD